MSASRANASAVNRRTSGSAQPQVKPGIQRGNQGGNGGGSGGGRGMAPPNGKAFQPNQYQQAAYPPSYPQQTQGFAPPPPAPPSFPQYGGPPQQQQQQYGGYSQQGHLDRGGYTQQNQYQYQPNTQQPTAAPAKVSLKNAIGFNSYRISQLEAAIESLPNFEELLAQHAATIENNGTTLQEGMKVVDEAVFNNIVSRLEKMEQSSTQNQKQSELISKKTQTTLQNFTKVFDSVKNDIQLLKQSYDSLHQFIMNDETTLLPSTSTSTSSTSSSLPSKQHIIESIHEENEEEEEEGDEEIISSKINKTGQNKSSNKASMTYKDFITKELKQTEISAE